MARVAGAAAAGGAQGRAASSPATAASTSRLTVPARAAIQNWPPMGESCLTGVTPEGDDGLRQRGQQRADLGLGVAAVAADRAQAGEFALLGPAADGLRGDLEELGDLGG